MTPRTRLAWAIAAAGTLCLAACGGGGGATSLAGSSATYSVNGTVAYGHPVAGRSIEAVDSTGAVCARALTGTDGAYSMDTTSCAPGSAALTVVGYATPAGAPLMALAVPAAGASVIAGVVNIDPLTTVLAYDAVGLVPSAAAPADSADVLGLLARVTSTQYLQARADILTAPLLQALAANGVSTTGFDPTSTNFLANGVGLDAFFDGYPLTAPGGASVQLMAPASAGPLVKVTLPASSGTPSTVSSVSSYSVGGSVSGLTGGSLSLQLNGGPAFVLSANGAFTFPTQVSSTYTVTVGSQPVGQTCTVSNGTGAGVTANVTNLSVNCSANTYTIGGSVSGLAGGAQLTLQDNGADPTVVNANGSFSFATPVAYGGGYSVTVASQPTGQTCTVSNASGTGVSSNVTNLSVTCATDTYTIGGTVTGLASGTQLTLDDNGADPTTVTANGSFSFATPVAYGGSYSVTVGTQPSGQTCTVGGGSGSAVHADVSSVSVSCVSAGNPLYVYVPDYNNAQVLGYKVDTVLRTVSSIPGSPFAAGAQDRWITVDSSGTYAFVSSQDTNSLFVYGVNHATGALTQLPGSPYTVGTTPTSVTLNPAGTLAFVPNANSATVSVFSIDRSTGALTPVPGSPFATGSIPTKVAVNPTGTFAFVGDQNGTEISVYAIDATTGTLTEVSGSPFANGGNQPMGITTDPSGTHLYATNAQCNVTGFDIDSSTGALTPIAGSPFAISSGCNNGAGMNTTFNGAGTLAFVSSGQGYALLTYSVDSGSGALTPLAGASPDMVGGGGSVFSTLDPSGTLLFEADYINIVVGIKQIDNVTGALTGVGPNPFSVGARPYDIAIVKP